MSILKKKQTEVQQFATVYIRNTERNNMKALTTIEITPGTIIISIDKETVLDTSSTPITHRILEEFLFSRRDQTLTVTDMVKLLNKESFIGKFVLKEII